MFKKIAAIVFVAIMAAGCGGLDSSTQAAKKPHQSVSASPLESQTELRKRVFLQLVKKNIPLIKVADDGLILRSGHMVCESLDTAGVSSRAELAAFAQGWAKGVREIFTSVEAYRFMGLSMAAFCPEYSALLPS